MSLGVEKIVEVVGAVKDAAIVVIGVGKSGGWSLGLFGKILGVFQDVKLVAADLPGLMPELKDLDAKEVGMLGTVCFEAIKEVMEAVVA